VERNRKTGQNPPRVVVLIEEEEDVFSWLFEWYEYFYLSDRNNGINY
jgi:hypothetical protein